MARRPRLRRDLELPMGDETHKGGINDYGNLGSRSPASFRGAWLSLRRGLVAGTDGEAAESGADVTAAWAAVAQTSGVKTPDFMLP
jgi:hypothetical protein